MQPNYDPLAVQPMVDELTGVGIQSLKSSKEVDQFLSEKGTTLVVINSVCGCAAGGARPGASLSLQHDKIPDRFVTVFAGMDHEAVQRTRELINLPPSSPCIALFKDGEVVFMLHRHDIEQMDLYLVAQNLAAAYDNFCTRSGPSVPKEVFESVPRSTECGSTIPAYGEIAN